MEEEAVVEGEEDDGEADQNGDEGGGVETGEDEGEESVDEEDGQVTEGEAGMSSERNEAAALIKQLQAIVHGRIEFRAMHRKLGLLNKKRMLMRHGLRHWSGRRLYLGGLSSGSEADGSGMENEAVGLDDLDDDSVSGDGDAGHADNVDVDAVLEDDGSDLPEEDGDRDGVDDEGGVDASDESDVSEADDALRDVNAALRDKNMWRELRDYVCWVDSSIEALDDIDEQMAATRAEAHALRMRLYRLRDEVLETAAAVEVVVDDDYVAGSDATAGASG